MEPLILSALAIGPGIGLAFYIYYADKWEPEPKNLLIQCFILGSLACIPAAWYESIFEEIFGLKGFFDNPGQFSVTPKASERAQTGIANKKYPNCRTSWLQYEKFFQSKSSKVSRLYKRNG